MDRSWRRYYNKPYFIGGRSRGLLFCFAYPNFEGIRGISMIIFLVWVLILGAAMLKKTAAKRI
jgi:hypothetical protein